MAHDWKDNHDRIYEGWCVKDCDNLQAGIFAGKRWLPGLQQRVQVSMFDEKSLKKTDPAYFNIIMVDDMDVTIQSRNTGHYWYLHCAGYPTKEALVIFHKHHFKDGYHQHGRAKTLRQAIKSR